MTAVLDARVPDLLDDLLRLAPPAPPLRRVAARVRAHDISARLYLLLRAVGSAAGLWITRHGLVSPTPAGADIYGHVLRTDFALHELFPHGRLDGWFPGLGGGYRLFAVNGPGLAVLAGILRLGSLGQMDTAQALALLGSLSIAVLPWAVALLSRELGASRVAAALHGVLALFVSFYAGGGLAGLYGPGLIAQSVALPVQVAALALVIRAVRHGGPRAVGTAAAAVAGLALLHPISILVLAVFAPLGMGRALWGAPVRRAVRALAVAAWAVALAGFWLVPAVRFRDHQGDATAWAIPPLPSRIGEVFRGDVLFPRLVAWAIVAAVVVTAVRALRRPALWPRLLPFAGAMVFLAAAHWAAGHELGPYDLRVQFPTRGLALAAILTLHPLALLLADLATWRPLVPADARARVERVEQGEGGAGRTWRVVQARWWRARDAGGVDGLGAGWRAVAVTAVVAVAVPGQLGGLLDPRQEAVPPSPALVGAAQQLEGLVPPMGRHLLVIPPTAAIGTDNPSRWLAAASRTNSAHLYFWEATDENALGVLAADLLWSIDPASALDALRRGGVTHVVTADPAQADALRATGGVVPAWWQDDVTIFGVLAAPGRPTPGSLLQPAVEEPLAFRLDATPTRQGPEHLTWDAASDTPLAVVAAVAHDPAWRATVDGRPVPVRRSSDGLVELDLPPGDHRIDLRFTATAPDPLGLALTLAALAYPIALALALAPGLPLAPEPRRRTDAHPDHP